jgi:tRNA-specific 2-thiouridylase
MGKKVVVGFSGGVDSSVAAHLLIEQGYDVIAIFMRNWHDESVIINNECPWIDDSNDAMLAAAHLGIPFHVLDMSAQYRQRIVDYMFREYEAGRTPNPDVLCNREIKFDLFLQAALNLKADFVATGHYCQKASFESANGETIYRLIAGADENKDQSYFLCQLNQQQLSKALFPIGHLKKPEVRRIAEEIGLPNAAKKDSQGLCFIGKVKLPVFLQQQLEVKRGQIFELPDRDDLFPSKLLGTKSDQELMDYCSPFSFRAEDGVLTGEHQGAHFYTVGQRKGLGVGGKALPLFILGTSVSKNHIFVGQGENHRGLIRNGLFIKNEDIHWVRPDLKLNPGEEESYELRIRYRQPLFTGKLICRELGLFVLFDETQRGLASGQFAAWYRGDELIGSGVIS